MTRFCLKVGVAVLGLTSVLSGLFVFGRVDNKEMSKVPLDFLDFIIQFFFFFFHFTLKKTGHGV